MERISAKVTPILSEEKGRAAHFGKSAVVQVIGRKAK